MRSNEAFAYSRTGDDVVQTAPVKCRYTKSGICANIAGFCLCRQANFALPSGHDARTGKSGAYVSPGPYQFVTGPLALPVASLAEF
jgi:hypothetical protein